MESLYHHVKELVPVGRLESAQAHAQPLQVFNYIMLDRVVRFLLLLLVRQLHLQQALLNQVVVIERAAHLNSALLVPLLELHQLLALVGRFIEHIWVEEATNVLVVSFQTLQDQQRRNNHKYFGFTVIKLFCECFVLLSCGLDHAGEVNQLVALLVVHEVGQPLGPGILKFN